MSEKSLIKRDCKLSAFSHKIKWLIIQTFVNSFGVHACYIDFIRLAPFKKLFYTIMKML